MNFFDSRKFLNLDKTPNQRIYLFLIYLGFFAFLQAVNYIFFQSDTRGIHVEYLYLVMEKFPTMLYDFDFAGTFVGEFLSVFVHNLFIHFLNLFFNASVETSFLWGNLIYSFLLMIFVDLTASKIYESYYFRIISVFLFMSIPGNISAMRLHTVHYAELVWLLAATLMYLLFIIKPSALKAAFLALALAFMVCLYRSGIIYGAVVFSFFILSLFFIKETVCRKLCFLGAFASVLLVMCYGLFMKFLYLEDASGEKCVADTLALIKNAEWKSLFLLEYFRLKNFVLYFFDTVLMWVYSALFVYISFFVLLFRSYRFFPKKNISFYLLLLCLLIGPGSAIAFTGIGSNGVVYPVYIGIYWFMLIGIYSFKFISRKFYLFSYALVLVVSFWMLLGSTADKGYMQSVYFSKDAKNTAGPIVRYVPFYSNPDLLGIIRYYIKSLGKKDDKKAVLAFVRNKDDNDGISDIPMLFFYLIHSGDIVLRDNLNIAEGDKKADIVITPLIESSLPADIYKFGLNHYKQDSLQKYHEFCNPKTLAYLASSAISHLPKGLESYTLKSVLFSPFGLDEYCDFRKYYFVFTLKKEDT